MADAAAMKVFISYSRKDREFVARVVDALEAEDGIEVFRDTDDILPTEEWQDRLEQLVREADTIVFALSPHSAKSEVCRWEVDLAESLNKRFAPIVIRDVEGEAIPPALAKLNYIFFTTDAEFDRSIGNLVAALNTDIDWIREHTRLANVARRWDLRGRPAINTLRGSDLKSAEEWIATHPGNAPQPTDLHHAFIQASRAAATKRQRMTVGGSLAAAVIAIALAGYALVQQRVATAERDRAVIAEGLAETRAVAERKARDEAETALRTATDSANRMVFKLAERFRDSSVPGRVIQQILDEARTLQDELSANFPDDPELQRSRAFALIQLGDVYRNLDDLAKAEAAYGEALDTSRNVARLDDAKTIWKRDVLLGLNRLGDVRLREGDTVAAEVFFAEALEIARNVSQANPDSGLYQRDVSIGLEKLGNLRREAGDYSGALKRYEESIALGRALAQANADTADFRYDLTVTLDKVGRMKLETGDRQGALASFTEEEALARELSASDPDNTTYRRALVIALNNLGRASQLSGDLAASRDAHTESLELMRTVAATDPDNTEWQRDISMGLHRLGDVHMERGDVAAARDAYTRSLRTSLDLASRDPSNALWLDDIAIGHERLGDTFLKTESPGEAAASFRKAESARRQLLERDPENPLLSRQLSYVLDKLGNARELQNDLAGAERSFTESAALRRRLVAESAGDPVLRRELSDALNRAADMQMRREAFATARATYRDSLAILRELVSQKPEDVSLQTSIAYHLFSIYVSTEAPAEKRALLEDMLAVLEPLETAGMIPPDFANWPDLARGELQALPVTAATPTSSEPAD
ncbi:TIR domain-containing protein [Tepidamorphus sp. 3E244]|uniref:TIR domain-containing protein n=1 Tax=Tepidamorphus sp. 3E244 TaxID=3385498 RepID=UPI0038FBF277